MNLAARLNQYDERLMNLFNVYLTEASSPHPLLQQAMEYGILNGGKRLRPKLVYITGTTLGASLETCDAPACAIEFIHGYSLIHDDLPAMDNADIRRGQPSCHKAYDEAMAILAGDALQTLAFEVLSHHPSPLTPSQRLLMIKTLSQASGYQGMAAGQSLDLSGTTSLLKMYHLKTGALLIAGVKLGAIAANITSQKILNALENYASHLGLAFQLQDDLLDFESLDQTGKPQGLDQKNFKNTFPVQMGKEKTQEEIKKLFNKAIDSLKCISESIGLVEFAHRLLDRKH